MLTTAQKEKYINYSGVRCPYCWSYKISSGHFDGESSSQPVECFACGKEWHDIFRLVDVEEEPEEVQAPETPCDDGSIAIDNERIKREQEDN